MIIRMLMEINFVYCFKTYDKMLKKIIFQDQVEHIFIYI